MNPYHYRRIVAEIYIHLQIGKQQNISSTSINLFKKYLLRARYVSGIILGPWYISEATCEADIQSRGQWEDRY